LGILIEGRFGGLLEFYLFQLLLGKVRKAPKEGEVKTGFLGRRGIDWGGFQLSSLAWKWFY